MFEYIFFNAKIRDKFVNHVQQYGVPCTTNEDHMGLQVEIPEDLPDLLADEIELYYETLETEQEELSKSEGELNRLASFRFNLPNGESRILPLQADLASRLMASFTLSEIQNLFDAVADCTLNQKETHLCKILAEQQLKQGSAAKNT